MSKDNTYVGSYWVTALKAAAAAMTNMLTGWRMTSLQKVVKIGLTPCGEE
jgi:hypothetical protein